MIFDIWIFLEVIPKDIMKVFDLVCIMHVTSFVTLTKHMHQMSHLTITSPASITVPEPQFSQFGRSPVRSIWYLIANMLWLWFTWATVQRCILHTVFPGRLLGCPEPGLFSHCSFKPPSFGTCVFLLCWILKPHCFFVTFPSYYC